MTDPFDRLAATYDETFTHTALGTALRGAVWRRLDALFPAGSELLEINGGTGVDAAHLAARGVRVLTTDASPEMVTRARQRFAREGVCDRATAAEMRIEDTVATLYPRRFDGVLSNFGGLNCVADLGAAAAQLAAVTRPGAPFLAAVMGPAVPWEWIWFGLRGEWRRAWRRRNPRGVEWRGRRVWYPSLSASRRAFEPWFTTVRTWGLGFLLPTTDAGAWTERHPTLLAGLDRIERAVERLPPAPRLADHYVIEMARRS